MDAEADRWLAKAEQDLDDAAYLLADARSGSASFFAQQAAEKALKAVLLRRTKSFPRIHDLPVLARRAEAPPAVVAACETLGPGYVAFRYPDVEEPVTEEDARELVRAAREVVAWARGQRS